MVLLYIYRSVFACLQCRVPDNSCCARPWSGYRHGRDVFAVCPEVGKYFLFRFIPWFCVYVRVLTGARVTNTPSLTWSLRTMLRPLRSGNGWGSKSLVACLGQRGWRIVRSWWMR